MLAAPNHTDANDLLYWTDASRNYNPEPKLSTITAHVLWINSADDHTNPAELGIAEKMVTRMPHARFVLIPISDETRGHGTSSVVHLWKDYFVQLMKETPPQ
jgi:homoserine O-acetyltransferase/O-succinyltransferase